MSLASSRAVRFTLVRLGGGRVYVVGFTRVLTRWGRCVPPRSLGSLRFALRVVWFIRGRWVHSGSPCRPLDSSCVVGFTLFRPRNRCVHPVLLGSLGYILEDAWFLRCSCVHSISAWGSMGSSRVVKFTWARPGCH